MSDVPDIDGQLRPPLNRFTCKHCGALGAPMAIFDSRQGSNVHLIRCASCNKLSWSEQAQGDAGLFPTQWPVLKT